jgi:1-deoxy-D-xylulose-5-phosphate reductoisomerase
MTKRIAILGSTGSIGRNALRVIDALGPEYSVVALSAHSNIELLAEQTKQYKPKFVAVTNPEYTEQFRGFLGDFSVKVLEGADGLVEAAELEDVDIVLTAIVGAAGLPAVFAAARSGKQLAVANKEPLVVAGELLMSEIKKNGGVILPVDSEHSAVFQAMQSGTCEEVDKIILTASGGPFRGINGEDIRNVTLEQALDHPVWNMGPKITVDSATLMNKAFEIIEARWLFDMPVEKIEVLIHPESIIHSLVEFVDGSVVAQLGEPDMCLPIQYALTYPKRVEGIAKRLKLEDISKLTFEKPDLETFRAIDLAYEVARAGGTAAAVFNAANEAAVEEFLAGGIEFVNILELIEYCLDKHDIKTSASIEELLDADAWARKEVKVKVHNSIRT